MLSYENTSQYRDKISERVHRCTPDEIPQLLALRREMFHDGPQADPAYFRWELAENPLAAGELESWVYVKDGKVWGEQAGIPVSLKIGSENYPAAWAVDLMVHPAQRLRGVGAVLSDCFLQNQSVTLGLSVSPKARRNFQRAGWHDLGQLPLWTRPLRLAASMPRTWPGRARTILGAADPLLDVFDRSLGIGLGTAGVRLERLFRFDGRADQIWRESSPYYPIICRRTQSELNWRYFGSAAKGRYSAVVLQLFGRPKGWAVLRLGMGHGLPIGYLVDFLAPPKWIAPLLAHVIARFRRENVAAIHCLHSGAAENILPWMGFVKRGSGSRFMFHTRRDLPAQAGEMLKNRGAWFLTAGDSDADHPRSDDAPASA